ncbi:MAG: toll/interleukin-1 receptor domain-containing protein [Chloroflexota bacterium]|nr:toll/interleukin-1 receptor domain-containing protein [Chloroflexota bacterium]
MMNKKNEPNLENQPIEQRIFLSYSRENTSIMKRILKKLESYGFSVWIDDNLILGTESWKTAIEDAIRQSQGLVVIMSPNSKESLWVERELDFARVQGVRIFPVLAAGEENNAIPNRYRSHSPQAKYHVTIL